jgi:hypothetical protein
MSSVVVDIISLLKNKVAGLETPARLQQEATTGDSGVIQ